MTPELRRPRVVIDNNVIIPPLTYESPETNWLVSLWQSGRIKPLVNDETIAELEAQILERSPTAKLFQAQRYVRKALRHYVPWCERAPLQDLPDAPHCRDSNDQMFIDLAIIGEADFLISRDDDLLSMNRLTSFCILNEAQFRAAVGL